MSLTDTKSLWQQLVDDGVQAVVDRMTDEESKHLTELYGTHNYKPVPVNIVRAEGARVWDGDGKEYIDCIGTYSASAHGHLNEFIVDTLKKQLDKVAVTSRAFYSGEVGLFMKALAEYSGLDMVCTMNTGAEANETCIKLARKWAYTVKGVPLNQAEIIACTDNFHGRTTTIVGFSSEEKYKKNFGPYGPGFKLIPFGDAAALEAAITPNTCAFLCEPIQAEGGILIPPAGWMKQVRDICTKHNVLLIWDEVQTGFCRTGSRFTYNQEDATPDLLAVGKPLGGGLLPVSAAVGKKHVMDVFELGDHGSTFGGNPLGAAVALAAMAEMETNDYAGQSRRSGDRLAKALEDLNHPLVKEVRHRGLLIGMELVEGADTKKMSVNLTANGVLTKETRHRTFRFTPPIMIEDNLIDQVIERVKKSLDNI